MRIQNKYKLTGEWLFSAHRRATRPSARLAIEHERTWDDLSASEKAYWNRLAAMARRKAQL